MIILLSQKKSLKKIYLFRRKHWKIHITFTVPIENEVTRIDKNGEEITKNELYMLQFIDSARFMVRSFWNLINNFSEGIHRDDKKCKTCRIKYKYWDSFLEYTNFTGDLIKYKCLFCNNSYQLKFDEEFKERFFNTYKFSNHDSNNFILFLQKKVYPFDYMDDWEIFNETSLPEKKRFLQSLKYGSFYWCKLHQRKKSL